MDTNLVTELIMRAARQADLDLRSYSGRGMGGAECIAVTSSQPVQRIVCMIIRGSREITRSESDLDAILEALEDAQTDSMGRDRVLYWPSLPWPSANDTAIA